jgi:GT2 family glycosyltransferase
LLASIIIVNYNGEPFIRRLFESLSQQSLNRSRFEIVFVDNASTDNSLTILGEIREKYASLQIKILRNKMNVGFVRGNSIGLQCAKGKYVVLLNNDTYVEPSWLEELVKVMENDATIGICESKEIVYKDDGSASVCIGVPFGILRRRKESKTIIRSNDGLIDVYFYASGACLIIRRDIITKLGHLFDERQFLGDLDLSWTTRLLGFRIVTNPKSICHHFYGYATKLVYRKNSDREYLHFHDTLRTMLKNYSLKTLTKRYPIYLATSIYLTLFKSVYNQEPVISGLLRALIWNLVNLRDTLSERSKMNRMQVTADDEIESFMLPYPPELYYFKLKLGKGKDDYVSIPR